MTNETKNFGVFMAIALAAMALVVATVAAVLSDGPAVSAFGAQGGTGSAPIAVTLKEFSITPMMINAKPGGDIVLALQNTGTQEHNFKLKRPVKGTKNLTPGTGQTLNLGPLPTGTYEVICDVPGHVGSGMTGMIHVDPNAPSGTDSAPELMSPEQMDSMMEKVALKFPAKTTGRGGDVMQPTIAGDGTKVYDIVAKVVDWEVEPGKVVKAYTYNGVVPGPTIKVNVGDRVRINLTNEMPESTSIHFHGIRVPNAMDGVDPYTQPAIKTGQSFVYEFTTLEPAVGIYHSHHNAQLQVPNGLFAAFLIGDMPIPASLGPRNVVKEMNMVLNDAGSIGLSLNGKSFPATEPTTLRVGESMIVHYMNEGLMAHPMHLHQPVGYIIAKDGIPLKEPFPGDTINIAPGERYTVLYTALDQGVWAWHCHILNHAEGPTGMFGMVTALIVEA